MSMPSLNDFQKKLYERLTGTGALTALVGTRIFNHIPPDTTAFPYVKFTIPTINDWSTKTEFGQDLEVQIDVWGSAEKAGDKQIIEVGEVIRDAVNRLPLALAGGQSVTLQLGSMFILTEPDEISHHLVSRYSALVTET